MFNKKFRLSIVFIAISSLLVASLPTIKASETYPKTKPNQYRPGEVLVQYMPSASGKAQELINEEAGVEKVSKRFKLKKQPSIQLLRLEKGVSVNEAIEELEDEKLVKFAEPNYIRKAFFTPDDSFFSLQYGHYNTGQTINSTAGTRDADMDTIEAWDIERGTTNNVTVAVIDTGMQLDHPDLTSIWQNSGEVGSGKETNSVDDDGNGYVDDWRGWDFVSSDNNPSDDHGHGTHVSGIIAANANNGTGVAGVSHGAKIMVLKAGDNEGYFLTSDIIAAVNYARTNGADIINMSYGGTSYNSSEQSALTNAYNAGVTLLAAAGNDYDTTINYPAGYSNVIGVGSTNNKDEKSSFSNYNSTVDISAPGSSIYSTYYDGSYIYMSGTSMATPMAVGVAALVLSKSPTYTPAQVQSVLQTTADDLGSAGRDDYFGYGRVNAQRALGGTPVADTVPDTGSSPDTGNADTTAPSAPTITSSTHPDSLKYYSNNDPSFALTSNETVSYSYSLDNSSSTIPDTSAESGATVNYTDLASGTWYLHARAADSAGNWSSTAHYAVNIDTTKPKTFAPKKAKGKKKKLVNIYYKVTDDYSGGKATVVIKIKKGRRVVRTVKVGLVNINKLNTYRLKATFGKGKYKFLIYAQDQAGNNQTNIASNKLIIK